MSALHLTMDQYSTLRRHLFQDDEVEHVAFGFTRSPTTSSGNDIVVDTLHLVSADEYAFQASYHVELLEDTHARLFQQATARNRGLVEIHSHLTELPARFSASDLSGFDEFVPHVMWRVPNVPYVAVVHHYSSFDGLIWRALRGAPEQLQSIQIDGKAHAATGRTLRDLAEDSYGRAI